MNNEIDLLIKAIESLQQESNIFKDYMFPIVSAFLSAVLGAGVAFITMKRQDLIQIEKNKIDVCNQWILNIENARLHLTAIKQNYHGNLTDDPIKRFFQIPSILIKPFFLADDLSGLAFIAKKSKKIKIENEKWLQLTRISVMVQNYNSLINIWEKRNNLERPLRERLLKESSSKAYAQIDYQQIVSIIGLADLVALIDLTELAVKNTDDLIIELYDFLIKFPKLAKPFIKKNIIKHYGSILTVEPNDNPMFYDILKRSPEVNCDILSELIGKSPESIKARYKTGYE